MIDTHCHLTFPELRERVDDVLAGAAEAGVSRLITVGTTPSDIEAARAIAETHAPVYFTAGLHPHYTAKVPLSAVPIVVQHATHERCVAFGEVGLDYHYDDPPRATQHEAFQAMLEAIRYSEIDKPIIIHCRKAVDDTLAMIRASGLPGERFVFHCFTEPPDDARKVLDAGCAISFTGIVTYKNAPEVRASAKLVPLDRIMVETDAPYLTPEPHRKVRPNEPKYVAATHAFLADLRGAEPAEFERITDANAKRIYGVE